MTQLAEIGSTGLKHNNGYLREEFHKDLQGPKAAKVYREMSDNCAITGAFLMAQEMLVRQVDWRVDPAKPKESSQEEADRAQAFVESCRLDMASTWQEVISETMTMSIYGWEYAEEVYKIRRGQQADRLLSSKHDDGMIGWADLAPRAQDSLLRWEIDDSGRTHGWWQQAEPDWKLRWQSLEKGLLFRPLFRRKSPEGRSLLRNAYRSWHFLKRIQELEAIGIARDMAGTVVIEIPPEYMDPNATAEQKRIRALYEEMARKIDRNEFEGIVIAAEETAEHGKTGYRLRLLQSGGTKQIDTNEVIKRIESRILISVLAEFLILGMDAHGSFALSDNKTNVFAMALGAMLGVICDVFNEVAIPRLCRLNGFDADVFPRLVHGDIETPELTQVANYVAQLAGVRAIDIDSELKRHLRRFGSMPVPEDGAEETEPKVEAVDGSVPAAGGAKTTVALDGGAAAQDSALNGAQVTSGLEIVERVATKRIPRKSGVAMLRRFFNLKSEDAEEIMGEIGDSFFAEPPPAPHGPGAKAAPADDEMDDAA